MRSFLYDEGEKGCNTIVLFFCTSQWTKKCKKDQQCTIHINHRKYIWCLSKLWQFEILLNKEKLLIFLSFLKYHLGSYLDTDKIFFLV
jgi:hypothetical protein